MPSQPEPPNQPTLNYQSPAAKPPLALPVWSLIMAIIGLAVMNAHRFIYQCIDVVASSRMSASDFPPAIVAGFASSIVGLGGILLFCIGAGRVLLWIGKRDDLIRKNGSSEKPGSKP